MKKLALVTALSTSIFLSGCLGQNALFNTLQDWNVDATPEPFINQGISFAFWFFPVYGLTLLADVIVFNSIEFWSGTNPVSQEKAIIEPKTAGMQQTVTDGLGNQAVLTYQADGSVLVQAEENGELREYRLIREDGQIIRQSPQQREVLGHYVM